MTLLTLLRMSYKTWENQRAYEPTFVAHFQNNNYKQSSVSEKQRNHYILFHREYEWLMRKQGTDYKSQKRAR